MITRMKIPDPQAKLDPDPTVKKNRMLDPAKHFSKNCFVCPSFTQLLIQAFIQALIQSLIQALIQSQIPSLFLPDNILCLYLRVSVLLLHHVNA